MTAIGIGISHVFELGAAPRENAFRGRSGLPTDAIAGAVLVTGVFAGVSGLPTDVDLSSFEGQSAVPTDAGAGAVVVTGDFAGNSGLPTDAATGTVEGDVEPFDPTAHTDAGLLLSWHRAELGTVLSTTLLAGGGGTPPAITLTERVGGSLAQPLELHLAVGAVDGARGTFTLDISIGGSLVANEVLSAATVDLDAALVGVETGLTLNIENAPASSGQTWDSVVATSKDLHSGNHDFTFNATKQPLVIKDALNGLAGHRYDGSNDIARCTTSLAADSVGGVDNSFHIFLVGRLLALPTGSNIHVLLCVSRSATSNNPRLELHARGPDALNPDVWRVVKQGDTGGGDLFQLDSNVVPDTSWHLFEIETNGSGTSATLRINGADVASGTMNTANFTVDQFQLGARRLTTTESNWANCELAELLVYSAPCADAAGIRAGLAAMYGLSI